jgi:hypothetical protein
MFFFALLGVGAAAVVQLGGLFACSKLAVASGPSIDAAGAQTSTEAPARRRASLATLADPTWSLFVRGL